MKRGDPMAKPKTTDKHRKPSNPEKVDGFEFKPDDYEPSEAELEEDLSVPVSLEQLAKAALTGGAKRKG